MDLAGGSGRRVAGPPHLTDRSPRRRATRAHSINVRFRRERSGRAKRARPTLVPLEVAELLALVLVFVVLTAFLAVATAVHFVLVAVVLCLVEVVRVLGFVCAGALTVVVVPGRRRRQRRSRPASELERRGADDARASIDSFSWASPKDPRAKQLRAPLMLGVVDLVPVPTSNAAKRTPSELRKPPPGRVA